MTKRLLTREEILSRKGQLAWRDVPMPEWGPDASVRVREMTSAERVKVEVGMIQTKGQNTGPNLQAYPLLRGRVLAKSCVDEQGRLLFSEEDVHTLTELGAGAIERLFDVACALSGLSKEDVNNLVGESEASQNGDSPSDSA